ncbi:hypothetical protein HRR83_005828 [Exophiala dermatitidis]|uniref:Uncharacterized protein n=1 Tax=Exophiala dermatitidis TaxID=5970 RepID=A0AAN6IUW8_EXODE|nr:hypothetical protein HRR73_007404 [Exophiala dermatitidis]KAJ4513385.1 hypothetical protein HRR74_006197 [Exophiala dermatitidis]KAJ4538063.1 hypothetical protein HRR77_007103 [Exophiala dermatitidis]KAJ4539795.1 hypothetical protein HRR76_003230 [Exophiala dermatitidis]KAJ4562354.1 hypothetical protein HRR79_006682 [Exophiala dermatitidis]
MGINSSLNSLLQPRHIRTEFHPVSRQQTHADTKLLTRQTKNLKQSTSFNGHLLDSHCQQRYFRRGQGGPTYQDLPLTTENQDRPLDQQLQGHGWGDSNNAYATTHTTTTNATQGPKLSLFL